MRAPGEGRAVRFRVFAHVDGAKEATVTIKPTPLGHLVEVRPKGRRVTYTLTLGNVAEMVAWRAAKIEAAKAGAA